MPALPPDPAAVLDFWFSLDRPGKQHDGQVREALGGLYQSAARGDLDGWANAPEQAAGAVNAAGAVSSAHSRLALILLLDQVPRHLFRGDPRTYATDHQAVELTAMFMGHAHEPEDRAMGDSPDDGNWGDLSALEIFYATHPWLHAENEQRQARINPIYHRITPGLPGLEYMAAIADLYWETIRRFGRFPHRNEILGRESTEEETRFLADEWNQRRRAARTCPVAAAKPSFSGEE